MKKKPILYVLALIVLTVCAYYLSSLDEFLARRETSAEVRQLLAQLQLVPDMVTATDPGTGKPWIFLHGNYTDKHSTLQAKYRSGVSAAEACGDILRYFKRHGEWNTGSGLGECRVGKRGDDPYVVAGFTALRKSPEHPNQFFLVTVNTRQYVEPRAPGGPPYHTEISIDITSSLDSAMFGHCGEIQLPGKTLCGDSDWEER